MKIRLLKDIRMAGAPTVLILAGSIVEATDATAAAWISAGAADVETAISKTVTETAVTHDVTDKKREQGRERVRRFREKQKGVTQ